MRTMSLLAAAASLAVWSGLALAQSSPPQARPGPAKPQGETRRAEGVEVDLRPRYTAGRVTQYELTIRSTSDLTGMGDGEPIAQVMEQIIGLSLKVVEAGAEGATIELAYDRMKVKLESGDVVGVFDSTAKSTAQPGKPVAPKSPKANPRPAQPPKPAEGDPDTNELLAQIMRPMVGTRLTMKVDKDGNILNVSGGDALSGAGALAGLLGGLSGAPGVSIPAPQAGGGGAGGPMSWMISGTRQKSVVRVGESWTNEDSLSGTPIGGLSMVTRHTCRSVSEGGRTANLVFNGRADTSSLSTPSATGFSLREAAYDGDYSWDTARGELRSMTSSMNTRLEANLAGQKMGLASRVRTVLRRLN